MSEILWYPSEFTIFTEQFWTIQKQAECTYADEHL